MKNIAIVYWSGTGNTEAMANAVLEGVQTAQAQGALFTPAEFSPELMDRFDAFAFGCPSMGVESLEDGEFEPMFQACEPKLAGKKLALFGSYGWGDGEWMRNWEDQCRGDGAELVCESVICCEAPDDEATENCRHLGAILAV